MRKIRNKPAAERAVALQYREKQDQVPKVVAKGEGLVARKIKEIAEASGIPIHRDNDLVDLLAQIDVDREIPPELYAAVAEVLAWIYRANGHAKGVGL